jgi:hypothetical protein
MPKYPNSAAWNVATSNNLKKGRTNGFRFQPYGFRSGSVDLQQLGLESRRREAHRVIRSSDIGQEWMRTQAAIDYSFEVWTKLLTPTDYNLCVVEEKC